MSATTGSPISIAPGTSTVLTGPTGASDYAFQGATGTFVTSPSAPWTGGLQGFRPGDTVLVTALPAWTSYIYDDASQRLNVYAGTTLVYSLIFREPAPGTYTTAAFSLSNNVSSGALNTITLAGPTYDTAANAVTSDASLATKANVTAINVIDTAANIAADLDGLNAVAKLGTITVSDHAPLQISYSQLLADTKALAALGSSYTLYVSGVPIAQIASVSALPHVLGVSLLDTSTPSTTATSITDAIPIQAGGSNFTTGPTPGRSDYAFQGATGNFNTSTVAQWFGGVDGFRPGNTITIFNLPAWTSFSYDDASQKLSIFAGSTVVYSLILRETTPGTYSTGAFALTANTSPGAINVLTLSGVTYDTAANAVSAAAALAAKANVTAINVIDTAANIAAKFDALNGLIKLGSIIISDHATLQISAAQYANNQTALAHLASGSNVAVVEPATGVSTVPSTASTPSVILPTGSATTISGALLGQVATILGAGSSATIAASTTYLRVLQTLATGDTGSMVNVVGGVTAISSGTDTIVAASGAPTITGGSGTPLVFGNSSALNFVGGTGASSIIGGTAGNTIIGGAGEMLLFATSRTTYAGGAGAATIIGGTGGLLADMGAGGGVVFGSTDGGNRLVTGSGNATLVGAASGDTVIVTGSGRNAVVAGAGAETIDASASSGNNVFFGGTGADVIIGGAGNDLFLLGTGSATLTGGGGQDAFVVVAGNTARSAVITDFDVSRDAVGLFGFGASATADAAALASATVGNGNTTVALSDGTRITFQGVTQLHSYNFF